VPHPQNFKTLFLKIVKNVVCETLIRGDPMCEKSNFLILFESQFQKSKKSPTDERGFWGLGQNPIRQPGIGPQKLLGSSVRNFWWQKFRPQETGSGRFFWVKQQPVDRVNALRAAIVSAQDAKKQRRLSF